METVKSSSSGSKEDDKPVIVRVKRKASHSLLDAFWLEINERPVKRTLLDFERLSMSDSSGKVAEEELRTKRVLVAHVETRGNSEATTQLLQSFMPTCPDGSESKMRNDERRNTFRRQNIREELLSKARKTTEFAAKNARFEQIWRSRRENNTKSDKALHEMYQFYDIVRIDEEQKTGTVPDEEPISLEDQKMLSSYLPLLKEFIPDAATEIESDVNGHASDQGNRDDYVYDYYVMQDDVVDVTQGNAFSALPLVRVDDADDFYDGPDSDYESDDSNAENNPLNDYPDETTDEENESSEESDSELEEEEDEEEEEEEEEGVEAIDLSSNADSYPYFEEDEDDFRVDMDGSDFGYGDGDDDADDSRLYEYRD